MSEEHRKPNDKRRNLQFLALFTLLAILAVSFFYATGCGFQEPTSPCERARGYYDIRDDLQNAVFGYAIDHNESLPILNCTYTNANCSNCNVINISALLTANGGMLRRTPDGFNLSTSGNDNCGGNASLGCEKGNSYIWIVDTDGTVFTYCAGSKCKTNDSLLQCEWPCDDCAWP